MSKESCQRPHPENRTKYFVTLQCSKHFVGRRLPSKRRGPIDFSGTESWALKIGTELAPYLYFHFKKIDVWVLLIFRERAARKSQIPRYRGFGSENGGSSPATVAMCGATGIFAILEPPHPRGLDLW